MYKLIACDVDGTLFDSSFVFPKANIDAIAKAQEKGVIFALCSGRSYKSLKAFAKELGIKPEGSHIIGFNGSVIYDFENSVVVKQENLDKDVGVRIVKAFKEVPRDIEIVIYIDGEHVLFEKGAQYAPIYQETSKCDWQDTEDIVSAVEELNSIAKIIFLGENSDLVKLEKEIEGHLGDETSTIFSASYMLETSPNISSKGNGVKWLCEKYNIDMSEVICIGDNHNDLSMIKAAGLGVAVANAVDAAKEIADYVTENDCMNGAVAEVINKFIL
ncbi:MAG: Cof-type HAD-IIB family hydrolase [Defluviitaleaceae bacterium]|nr:Cof-type HAD-IIB family hydrolase [Defluviitaleaceae bacterium]